MQGDDLDRQEQAEYVEIADASHGVTIEKAAETNELLRGCFARAR